MKTIINNDFREAHLWIIMHSINSATAVHRLLRSRRKSGGCIVNTLGQVTVSPVQVAVTINKENQTTRTILESGKFSATVLAESAR